MALNPNDITSSDHPATILPNAPEHIFRSRVKDNIDTLWQRIGLLRKQLGGGDTFPLPQNVTSVPFVPPPPVIPPTTPVVIEQYFGGYDKLGGDTVGLVDKDLEIHQKERADLAYIHVLGSPDVEINQNGDYEITLDAGFEMNEGDTIEIRLQRNTGGGYSDVDGARAYCSA